MAVIADELVLERGPGDGGQAVTLDAPASELVVGLPYTHVIEPMPATFGAARVGGQDRCIGRCASRFACSRRRACTSTPATGCRRPAAHDWRRPEGPQPRPIHRRPLAARARLAARHRAAALADRAGHAPALRAALCNHGSEGEQLMGAFTSLATTRPQPRARAAGAQRPSPATSSAERDRQDSGDPGAQPGGETASSSEALRRRLAGAARARRSRRRRRRAARPMPFCAV